MTTPDQAAEAVYQRWTDQWGTTTDFVFENEDFDPESDDPWARVTVLDTARTQETMGVPGNRRFRSQASVLVQVYVRANTGVQQANALAKQAADIFEGVSFSGLAFRASVTRRTGVKGRWHQTVVEADFDYEEIK